MIKRLVAVAFLVGLLSSQVWGQFSYPTPGTMPTPFVGVTTQPTPAPMLPQIELCFQDQNGPLGCGANLIVAAGDYVGVGISVGPPAANGTPSGPFPSTVILSVNGTVYSSVPVGVNGLIGYASLPGLQVITVQVRATGYVGSVETVVTH